MILLEELPLQKIHIIHGALDYTLRFLRIIYSKLVSLCSFLRLSHFLWLYFCVIFFCSYICNLQISILLLNFPLEDMDQVGTPIDPPVGPLPNSGHHLLIYQMKLLQFFLLNKLLQRLRHLQRHSSPLIHIFFILHSLIIHTIHIIPLSLTIPLNIPLPLLLLIQCNQINSISVL